MPTSSERAIAGLATIGFWDIRKLFRSDGQLIPICDLNDDIAGAIVAIEVVPKTLPPPHGEPPKVGCIEKIKL